MEGYQPYKGRTFNPNKKVEVYRNLTFKCLSVAQDGLVVARVQSIKLKDVSYHISQSKYQEFLRTGHKNVHARAKGHIVTSIGGSDLERVFYNPQVAPYFRDSNEQRIDQTKTLEVHTSGFMQATI